MAFWNAYTEPENTGSVPGVPVTVPMLTENAFSCFLRPSSDAVTKV